MFEAIDTTIKIEVPKDILKSLSPPAKEAESRAGPTVENQEKESPEKLKFSKDLLAELEPSVQTTHNVKLQFSLHEQTGRIIATMIDMDTEEKIREIPSEKVLDLAARINEMAGILFDKKV